MSNDIDMVKQLRETDGGYFMRKMFTEAANEIENLRLQVQELRNILESHEVFQCTLCGKWGYAVNRFKDCKACAKGQYAD